MRIGLSSCIMHKDPTRPIFKGKALVYAEESLCHWLMAKGVPAFLIPTAPARGVILRDLVAQMDGIVLQGGVDVSPLSYGEEPLKPDWSGDKVRDEHEIGIIKAALALNKPILGICRGLQVINVALGGTLYQDITTQLPGAFVHRDWEIYDQNFHEADIVPGSRLATIYGGRTRVRINSVHHQGVKTLAPGLLSEATSVGDGIIEAVRLESRSKGDPYLAAVQWHPEFQDPGNTALLPTGPLLDDFIAEVTRRM